MKLSRSPLPCMVLPTKCGRKAVVWGKDLEIVSFNGKVFIEGVDPLEEDFLWQVAGVKGNGGILVSGDMEVSRRLKAGTNPESQERDVLAWLYDYDPSVEF